MEAAVGVAVRVFKVCSQDTGSAAFGGADHVDSCRVWTGFNSASWSRTSKRGYGGAILRRDQVCRAVPTWKPGHYFNELLFWQTLALMFATVCGGFWKNFLRFSVWWWTRILRSARRVHLEIWNCFHDSLVSGPGCISLTGFRTNFALFLVKANSDPGVQSASMCDEWSYGGGGVLFFFFASFEWHFSHSVHLDVECPAGCDFFHSRWPTVVGRRGPRAMSINFCEMLT